MKLITLLALTLSALTAQTTPVKPEPRITVEQQLAYFQARAELAEAKLAALEAEKPVAAAVADLQKTCPVTLDDKRRPVCQPKQAEKPVPPAK